MKLSIAHRLFAEAALCGMKLIVDGERLAYAPSDLMLVPLLWSITEHQRELKPLIRELACCMAAPYHVRRFIAALLVLSRREGDRCRARWVRWDWRNQVECHLNWPLPRPCAEAAAAIQLVEDVIQQRGRRGAR